MADIGLTAKQLDSVRHSDGLVNIWDGAVSSGKTVASMIRWSMFIAATGDLPGEHVVSGRTRDSVWRNVLLPLGDVYPGLMVGNVGAPTARVAGRRVHVIGANDVQAEMAIRGMTCLSVYLDEVTTLPEPFFNMAVSRLRVAGRSGGVASKLFGSTNPDSALHWLKLALDRELPTWRRFHFRLDDNPRLPPEYVAAMQAQFSGLFRLRFLDGLWVMGEGAVFGNFDPARHVRPAASFPVMEKLEAVGVDYGNTHKSAAVLLGRAQGKLWVLDEWCPQRSEGIVLAPSVQSASLRRKLASWGQPEWVFVDSAAKAFRDQLHADGQVTAPAWKDVVPGIQLLHSLFELDRLVISDKCPGLVAELPGYTWDDKAALRGVDQPRKINDDHVDALRYAVYSSRPQWQPWVDMTYTWG